MLSLFPLTARNAPFKEEMSVKSSGILHLKPAAWLFSEESNTKKNYIRCFKRLAIMSVEVDVRFIVLSVPLITRKTPFVEEMSVKSP